jgi:putative hydrolase of the HAD superfamily
VERSPSVAAVVFDIGGVLVVAESAALALAPSVGVDPRQFDNAYWHHRPAFDLGGMSPAEYWGAVAADVGLELSAAQVERYDQVDAMRWARLSPGRGELLADIAAAPVRTAILSNAPRSLATRVRAGWGTWASTSVFSCEVGVMKPDARIYELVEDGLGLPGEGIAFFDDRPENVAAARDRGWRAHVWESPERCRVALHELGVLDA